MVSINQTVWKGIWKGLEQSREPRTWSRRLDSRGMSVRRQRKHGMSKRRYGSHVCQVQGYACWKQVHVNEAMPYTANDRSFVLFDARWEWMLSIFCYWTKYAAPRELLYFLLVFCYGRTLFLFLFLTFWLRLFHSRMAARTFFDLFLLSCWYS